MKEKISIIATELFHISLVTYVLFLMADIIREESVSFFFNLHILLGVVLVSGIASTLLSHNTEHRTEAGTSSRLDRSLSVILSVGGGLLILQKTYSLGFISFVISISASLLIALLSHLILQPEPEKNGS